MNRSETITKLAAALVKAQGQFTAIPKTESNPFFKSKYADLATVIGTAQPILTENGLAVLQANTPNGTDSIIVETVLIHSSGEFVSGQLEVPLGKKDAQGVGSAITYGRRYGYMAILGLVADEDDDGNNASKPNGAKSPVKDNYQLRGQEIAKQLVSGGSLTNEQVKSDYLPAGKKKFADLTDAEAQEAYNKLVAFYDSKGA